VKQVIPLGTEGGAGNLVICQVLLMHINENVLDENKMIDPHKLDAVARMGQNYYSRASGDSVFVVPKPNEKIGIGYDLLPEKIKTSNILTGNDLGMLANIDQLPPRRTLEANELEAWNAGLAAVHQLAQHYLKQGKVTEAWQLLLHG
jgi:hypothetical protein